MQPYTYKLPEAVHVTVVGVQGIGFGARWPGF